MSFELKLPDEYTCIGKGGSYWLIGESKGAGERRDETLVIYNDRATGQVYHRTPEDFAGRMQLVPAATHVAEHNASLAVKP